MKNYTGDKRSIYDEWCRSVGCISSYPDDTDRRVAATFHSPPTQGVADVVVRDQISVEATSLYDNGASYAIVPDHFSSTTLERPMRDVFEEAVSPRPLRQTEIRSLRQKD